MNKILKLFDEKYALDLIKKEILPLYSCFYDVGQIEIKAYKKNIWKDTYHVVVEFRTSFIDEGGLAVKVPIFCSAHSNEPRKNVHEALQYLWNNGFADSQYVIPRPLYYSDYFKASFYRGVEGNNLYHYIRNNELEEVEKIVIRTAGLFAKLHKLPTQKARNFNQENSRIRTVIPGRDHIIESVKMKYNGFSQVYEKAYDKFIEKEEKYLSETKSLCLVHGDAHPENIIKVSDTELGVIDFTDICLGDFARDLGCFLQQLDYMGKRKIADSKFTDKIKGVFLDNYLENVKIELNEALKKRIDVYYNWTAIRTATFFLIKDKPEPERGEELIKEIKQRMKI